MKHALITGVGGFVGSHLAEYLISNNIKVTGLVHPDHPSNNLKAIENQIDIIKCDIMHKGSVVKNIKSKDFNYVFHLAAFSSPSESFKNPKDTLENNIIGQLNILESLVKNKSKAKILIVGSSDEYGEINPPYLPIDEQTLLSPTSPYAVSKVAQDLLGYQFFLQYKLQIVRVRPFNHIGPRQSPLFVVSAFASRIVKLEKQNGGKLKVGSINAYRDFTDVRDMVRAYHLALDKCQIGDVYNIGSAKSYKISTILQKLLSFTQVKIEIEEDKELIRKNEIPRLICNNSKFVKATGWKPLVSIDKTLSDTIIYERSQLN